MSKTNRVDVLAVLDSVPGIVELAANDLLTMYSTPGGRPHDPDPAIAYGLQKVRAARAAVAELAAAARLACATDKVTDGLRAALAAFEVTP